MKPILLTIVLFTQFVTCSGQDKDFDDSVSVWFDEIKSATKRNQTIWNRDLYAPILLVNPNTREVFGNLADTARVLRQDGAIYRGTLPNEVNIANTAVTWNGRRWAMVMLPLPTDKHSRISLLAHELFHVAQPALGFELFNVENNHLNLKDGRTYLRLELEALKKALFSVNKADVKRHLRSALYFRKYRHLLFLGAPINENLLELNEGIAEYTGLQIGGTTTNQSEYLIQSIKTFLRNPTFVRSFAYQTIPIYGYLLSTLKKDWHKEVTVNTNLTEYFVRAFGVSIPNDLKRVTDLLLNEYHGDIIIAEETIRDQDIKNLISDYKRKFLEQPHFEIVFEQMHVSFDPRNIVPLEDNGSVYQNLRVSDNWGIITISNGALMSPNWNKLSVTVPTNSDGNFFFGDGWKLELKDGYSVQKDEETGNFRLVRK